MTEHLPDQKTWLGLQNLKVGPKTMINAADLKTIDQPQGAGANAPAAAAPVADLQIDYLSPGQLRPASRNARTHSKKQLKQIARSIERFGFVNPVLIADDFEIIAGHGRVEAAKLLGLRQVPTVRLSNLSAAERRAYVIADNRLAQLAGWDRALLAAELQGLLDLKFDDVELTGFSLDEIDVPGDAATKGTGEPRGRTKAQPIRQAHRCRDRATCGSWASTV